MLSVKFSSSVEEFLIKYNTKLPTHSHKVFVFYGYRTYNTLNEVVQRILMENYIGVTFHSLTPREYIDERIQEPPPASCVIA